MTLPNLPLTGEQLDREQEQTDHVVMLSELQTLLTQQKRARETLEQQLEEEKAERKKLQTALQVTEHCSVSSVME